MSRHAEILSFMRAFHRAMAAPSDLVTLARLTSSSYYLIHLTGRVQPRAEWFAGIQDKTYHYRQLEYDEGSVALHDSRDDTGITLATGRLMINRKWPLEFDMHLAKQATGEWMALHTKYSLH